LRASELHRVLGVLKGEAETVARNEAMPIVPATVLRNWATEQAELIAASKFSGTDKLSIASLVMLLGGNASCLPIAVRNDEYCTENKIKELISNLDFVQVYYGNSIDYDENDDGHVRPKDFNNELSVSETLFLVPSGYRQSVLKIGDKSWPECIPNLYETGKPIDCKGAFESILKQVWGDELDWEDCERIVGSVYDEEIKREVRVYSRPADTAEFV
jgi:hypothetical protein